MTYSLCAIGNALVDIIVTCDDDFLRLHNIAKGAMTLVDAATSSALYQRAGAAVEMASGGSAANTLAGFASLGGSGAFMGKIGRDQFGEAFGHDLQAQKLRFAAQVSPDLPTGHCLIFVTPDGQRSMCTCLGAAGEFGSGDIDEDLVRDSAITYLEGYLYDKPAAQEAFRKVAQIAHAAGRQVAFTLSDAFCVSRHRDAFMALVDGNIMFANEGEVKALYQTDDLKAAIAAARAQATVAVITRGAQGAVIAKGNETFEVAAQPVDAVIDTTGAGDLFAAGFLYGLAHGQSLPEAGRVGAIAAAEVISHYGPRPQKKLSGLI